MDTIHQQSLEEHTSLSLSQTELVINYDGETECVAFEDANEVQVLQNETLDSDSVSQLPSTIEGSNSFAVADVDSLTPASAIDSNSLITDTNTTVDNAGLSTVAESTPVTECDIGKLLQHGINVQELSRGAYI